MTFPDEETPNPRLEIAFPDREKQNPNQEMTFPDEETPNPRVEITFPDQEKQNQNQEMTFPDEEKQKSSCERCSSRMLRAELRRAPGEARSMLKAPDHTAIKKVVL